MLKSDLLLCIKKKKKKSSLPAKMIAYSKSFAGQGMIIGHYYNLPVCFVCLCL